MISLQSVAWFFFFVDRQPIEQKVKCTRCLTLWYFKNWKRLQSRSQWTAAFYDEFDHCGSYWPLEPIMGRERGQ